MKNVAIAVLTSLIAVCASGSEVLDRTTDPDYQQHLDDLNQFMGLVEELRDQIDRSSFDLEALLDKLDYDAERIAAFVREEIYFEQYSGLLRGAQGTLMSRSGNALDQSVLLATLLNDAGYDARIGVGSLDGDSIRRLLQLLTQRRRGRPALGDSQGIEAAISSMRELMRTELTSVSDDSERLPVDELLERNSTLILRKLAEADRSFPRRSASRDEIDVETADYYWVQYRDGPTDAWRSVHPAFGGDEPPSVEPTGWLVGEVPSELQHRIRVQSKIARRLGDRIEESSLMNAWEHPASNLVGMPITLSNEPNGVGAITDWEPLKVKETLANSTLFRPKLNGSPPAASKLFDFYGNTVDPMAAGSPMAGIVQEVGSSFVDATTSLGGLTASKSEQTTAMALETLWIEITRISPGGAEETFRRVVAKQEDDRGVFAAKLGRDVTLSISTGELPDGYVLDYILGEILRLQPVMTSILLAEEPDPQALDQSFMQIGEALVFFKLSSASAAVGHSYYSEPAIVARYRDNFMIDDVPEGFDIINSTRRAFVLDAGQVSPSPDTVMRQGVWETLSESIVFSSSSPSARFFDSLGKSFTAEQFLVVTEADDVAGLGDAERAHLIDDLQRGYVLIYPKRADERGRSGWWRVDPIHGETLGRIGPMGWGGAVAERTTVDDLWEELMCEANVWGNCTRVFTGGVDAVKAISELGFKAGEGLTLPVAGVPSIWDALVPTAAWTQALINKFMSGAISREAAIQACYEVGSKLCERGRRKRGVPEPGL